MNLGKEAGIMHGMRAALLLPFLLACAHRPPPAPGQALVLRDATAAEVLAEVKAGDARLTVVNVWATWCEPCVEEFPDLVRIANEDRAQGVRVLFVSTDFASNRDEVIAFLERHGVTGVSFRKAEDDQTFIDALEPRWSGTLPATLVFDRAGRVRHFQEEPTTAEALRERLAGIDPT